MIRLKYLESFCAGFMFIFCALDDAGMMLESKSSGHSNEMFVSLGLVPWSSLMFVVSRRLQEFSRRLFHERMTAYLQLYSRLHNQLDNQINITLVQSPKRDNMRDVLEYIIITWHQDLHYQKFNLSVIC